MADDVERNASKISAEWKQLSEEERKGFESKDLDLKIQYDKQMTEYRKFDRCELSQAT